MRGWLAIAIAGCAASPAPIANQPPPAAPAPPAAASHACTLDWLANVDTINVSEVSDGHFGYWEFHVDLIRRPDPGVFEGVAVGAFHRYPNTPVQSQAVELHLPRTKVATILDAMRSASQLPAIPNPRATSIVDTSFSATLTVALGAKAQHIDFVTERGQQQPQPWYARAGCELTISRDGGAAMAKAYDQLQKLVGRDAMYDALDKRTPP